MSQSYRAALLWASVLILLSGLQLAAQPNCSIDTIVGTYAVRGQATLLMPVPGSDQPAPVPMVLVGIASIDSGGRMSGTAFGTFGGDTLEATVTGTVEVKSDCTATQRIIFDGGQAIPAVNKWVIFDDGEAIASTSLQSGAGKLVLSERLKRLSRVPGDAFSAYTPCTKDMLRGTYAYFYDGSMLITPPGGSQPMPLPANMSGLAWMDKSGNMPMKATFNVGGNVSDLFMTSAGAAKVNANCTGSATFKITGDGAMPGEGMDRFVVIDGGRELWTVTVKGIMGKPAILGTMKQISVQALQ